jgi:hypothetical protein
MYEKRAAAADAANNSDGRPRWMRDHDHTGGEIGPLTKAPPFSQGQDRSHSITLARRYL